MTTQTLSPTDSGLQQVDSTLSHEAGFNIPVYLTPAAKDDLVTWDEKNAGGQDEAGRTWDVLNMARFGFSRNLRAGGDANLPVPFILYRVPNTRRATTPRRVQPVLTPTFVDGAPAFVVSTMGEGVPSV